MSHLAAVFTCTGHVQQRPADQILTKSQSKTNLVPGDMTLAPKEQSNLLSLALHRQTPNTSILAGGCKVYGA